MAFDILPATLIRVCHNATVLHQAKFGMYRPKLVRSIVGPSHMLMDLTTDNLAIVQLELIGTIQRAG